MTQNERNALNRIYGLLDGLTWGVTEGMSSDAIAEALGYAMDQLEEVLTGQKPQGLVDKGTIDRVRAEFKAKMEGKSE